MSVWRKRKWRNHFLFFPQDTESFFGEFKNWYILFSINLWIIVMNKSWRLGHNNLLSYDFPEIYRIYCVYITWFFLNPNNSGTKIIMVKLFDISKLRCYVAYHSSKKISKMSKNINLIYFHHFGHFWMSHDMINTKFRNILKIGVWAYFWGPYGHEGMVCQSRDTRDLLSELRALQNRRHFRSTMFRTKGTKHRFFAN